MRGQRRSFAGAGGGAVCPGGSAALLVGPQENRLGEHVAPYRLFERCLHEPGVPGLEPFRGASWCATPRVARPTPALASYLMERLEDRRFPLSPDGPGHDVVKVKPLS
jgi:hypothetical protein